MDARRGIPPHSGATPRCQLKSGRAPGPRAHWPRLAPPTTLNPMAAPVSPADFKEVLIVLGAAAVVVPLFYRLRVSPVIGFMLVGMAVGPAGLGGLAGGGGRAPPRVPPL